MADRLYPFHDPRMMHPPQHFAAVTPNDGADLDYVTRAIYVGTAGNVSIVNESGVTTVIPVLAGVTPMQVARINATGTTAANIVAAW